MSYDKVMKDTKERMDKALKHTHDQLRNIRTSRASSGLVENIRVDYYGSPTPLSQIAQISVPEPRQLVIKPFDASAIEEIGKAILKSDLGISPENDGKVVRLTMPPLSGDQRKKYARCPCHLPKPMPLFFTTGAAPMRARAPFGHSSSYSVLCIRFVSTLVVSL